MDVQQDKKAGSQQASGEHEEGHQLSGFGWGSNPMGDAMGGSIQRKAAPVQFQLEAKQRNQTGMPDQLKSGIESLSGIDMSDVRVHRDSAKPAEVGALAYAQGTDIHLGAGQEQHLAHEAWHVVQQKQGRVAETTQMKGIAINDDSALEREADIMGAKALQMKAAPSTYSLENGQTSTAVQRKVVQRFIGPDGIENNFPPIGGVGQFQFIQGAVFFQPLFGPAEYLGTVAEVAAMAAAPPPMPAATDPHDTNPRKRPRHLDHTSSDSAPSGGMPLLDQWTGAAASTDDGTGVASLDEDEDYDGSLADDEGDGFLDEDAYEGDLSDGEESIDTEDAVQTLLSLHVPTSLGAPTTSDAPPSTGTGALPALSTPPTPPLVAADFSEDDQPEVSVADSATHHKRSISEMLKKGQDEFERDSSDSDIGHDHPFLAGRGLTHKEYATGRRMQKAREIEAILRTAFPVDAEGQKDIEALREGRKKDYAARKGKRGRYSKETLAMLAKQARAMKETSLLHNTFLRRAARTSISKEDRSASTSKKYEGTQGRIREHLSKVLKKEQETMKFTDKDFSSPTLWAAFQWILANTWSNDAKKAGRLDASSSASPGADFTPRAAFHHVYWKESMGKDSEAFALTPANLSLCQDDRERSDKKKKAATKAVPDPGQHEYFHQLFGYKTTDKEWAGDRFAKGGHFKAIDLEATAFALSLLTQPRKSKLEAAAELAPKTSAAALSSAGPVTAGHPASSTATPDAGSASTPDHAAPDPTLDFDDDDLQMLELLHLMMIGPHNQMGSNLSDLPNDIVGMGSLMQNDNECGQMAAHNAMTMAGVPFAMEALRGQTGNMNIFRQHAGHEPTLDGFGMFENMADEAAVVEMLEGQGNGNIMVANSLAQMQTFTQELRAHGPGHFRTTYGDDMADMHISRYYALHQFLTGATDHLVLVLHTHAGQAPSSAASKPPATEAPTGGSAATSVTSASAASSHDSGDAVKMPPIKTKKGPAHWIAVRVDRRANGTLGITFMDSLHKASAYTPLLTQLRAMLQGLEAIPHPAV